MYEIWQMCSMGECTELEPLIKEFESDDIEETLSELETLRKDGGIYQIITV
jgi:hypothetical protein